MFVDAVVGRCPRPRRATATRGVGRPVDLRAGAARGDLLGLRIHRGEVAGPNQETTAWTAEDWSALPSEASSKIVFWSPVAPSMFAIHPPALCPPCAELGCAEAVFGRVGPEPAHGGLHVLAPAGVPAGEAVVHGRDREALRDKPVGRIAPTPSRPSRRLLRG